MEPIILPKVVRKEELVAGNKAMLLSSFQRACTIRNSNEKRWLEDGEIIEFTDVRFTEHNAEFEINHNQDFMIWFSQLDDIYVNPLPENLDDFVILSQTWQSFHDDPMKFWNYVKGKKFRVKVDVKHFCIINRNHKIVEELIFMDKLLKYYFDNYSAGKYEAIKGMLKKVRCYSFEVL